MGYDKKINVEMIPEKDQLKSEYCLPDYMTRLYIKV